MARLRLDFLVHGKNGGAAANIENDLVLEQVLVVDDCAHVRFRADFIFLQNVHHSSVGRFVEQLHMRACEG